jgi:hypothetical protein
MTRYNPAYRVEIAPGIFRRISPVTGEPETHITREGLRYLRARRFGRDAGSFLSSSFVSGFTAAAVAARVAAEAFEASRWILAAPVPVVDRRADELRAAIMRRCSGNRRRQARVCR